ncbi:MAG TPA: presqualene diphosphate synthase HpnD [Vicinamibacterales bacterium]|nr:presqualene diphosphate synthase HpnD [Vicinamibacterales bacterium]
MARDTSFYYSFLVLPAEKRRAIVAVWDFCRAVDDEVDDAGEARVSVQRWRDELDSCYGEGGLNTGPSTPQGQALRPFIERFNLPRGAFEELIDGVEMDLTQTRYATFADLHQYCLRVASAVGLVCVEIFGYRDPAARTYASELGVALQLTNILRDVPVDLARGRIYIPVEDLDRFGVTEADLRAACAADGAGPSPPLRDLLAFQAARARRYYARAREALPREDARRLVAAEIMSGIYRGVLTRIEGSGYDVFSRRIRVPRPARAWIAAATWARTQLLRV